MSSNGRTLKQQTPSAAAPPPAASPPAASPPTPAPRGAPADFMPLTGARVEVSRWLDRHDFIVGRLFTLRLLDAQLIADESRGFRVAYVAELVEGLPARPAKDAQGKETKHPEALPAGTCIMFGEKFDLRSLRRCYVGDVVRLTVTGVKELKGGRTLMTFGQAVSTQVRRGFDSKLMPKTLGTLLTEAWKSGAARGADEWEGEAAAPASQEEAPF